MDTKKLNPHWVAGTSMLFGPFLVFGLILLMNGFMGKLEKVPPKEVTQVSMVKQVKVEPKKEIKKPEPKRQRIRPTRPEPFKGLSTALSGIDMGLFGLNEDGMTGIDDSLLGKVGNAVMTEDLVDVPPKAIARGSFKYPQSAKKKGIKGYVVLSILVDVDGSVNRAQVLESNPAGVFDEAALQGMRSWQFEPAQYKGDRVKVWAKQKIRFDLS